MTMTIHVQTQVFENYGTPASPYWKAKGGQTFVLTGIDLPMTDQIASVASKAVDAVRRRVEVDNTMFQESIIDWELVPGESLTQWEKDQMEFEGHISSLSPRIAVDDPTGWSNGECEHGYAVGCRACNPDR